MGRGPIMLSGLPSSNAGAPRWRRLLPGSFGLALILTGLATSLLTLAGAALIGENRDLLTREEPGPSCTAFQVGSPFAANTELHLENVGLVTASVRFDFVDDFGGQGSWAIGYGHSMAPGASFDVLFRTPALGTVVMLSSSGGDLRTSTHIVRDDGTPIENRGPVQCRAVS
jgi:hypothetical protein